ncbi:hypothetical protein LIER_18581 [Lithospermum erythrorhizon]|uniref:Uncharacterized protein n=1 Tax=Lithospermum erythrorhizon TaxID=34254 RepID=A0AAV3QIP5_LITER
MVQLYSFFSDFQKQVKGNNLPLAESRFMINQQVNMSLRSTERNNICWSRYKVAMDANEDSGDDGDGDCESSNQQFKIKDAICYTTVLNVRSNKSDKEVCNGLRKIKTTQEPLLHNRSSTVELKQKVRRQRYKLTVGIDEERRKRSNQLVENWKTNREENLLKKHHEVHLQSFTI